MSFHGTSYLFRDADGVINGIMNDCHTDGQQGGDQKSEEYIQTCLGKNRFATGPSRVRDLVKAGALVVAEIAGDDGDAIVTGVESNVASRVGDVLVEGKGGADPVGVQQLNVFRRRLQAAAQELQEIVLSLNGLGKEEQLYLSFLQILALM